MDRNVLDPAPLGQAIFDLVPPRGIEQSHVQSGRSDIGSQSRDAALRARAQRVVPGGMWGHLNAARLPEGYPQFFASAEGCRIRDVDGREYVDFMCSWGPILLGHQHPEVQAAATRRRRAATV